MPISAQKSACFDLSPQKATMNQAHKKRELIDLQIL